MNGVHDLGGMHGFGPIEREANEPAFHSAWERQVFGVMLGAMGLRKFNVDEFRRTIERMPPARYLAASYYERWLHAIETLLIEKNVLSRAEINARLGELGVRDDSTGGAHDLAPAHTTPNRSNSAARSGDLTEGQSTPLRRNPGHKPRFKPGDRVIARNLNPHGHTRIPRYVRGHRGVVRRNWGVFAFPDTHAHGLGANPQHCYAVEFAARELWGDDAAAGDSLYVDLWEDYLAPARTRVSKPAPRAIKRSAPARRRVKTAAKLRRGRR
ncbi:MAG TPA: nitrile hydratase subunit beta [Candidatus Binataceae bacterium]|nr:nitrile hydratase subunit beta [Candidatus Binataceae bacterium]